MEEIEIKKEMEYLLFSRAYLILAYRGIEEVIKRISDGVFENPFGEIKPTDWVYKNNYLVVPAIYNLKHAIEIFIKTLTLFFNTQPNEHHDLSLLFAGLKKNISGKTVDELELLIFRYYHNEFLKNKFEVSCDLKDPKNDFFRYPKNKAGVDIKFFRILPKFQISELKNMQKDVKELDRLFYQIGEKILEAKIGPRPELGQLENVLESN